MLFLIASGRTFPGHTVPESHLANTGVWMSSRRRRDAKRTAGKSPIRVVYAKHKSLAASCRCPRVPGNAWRVHPFVSVRQQLRTRFNYRYRNGRHSQSIPVSTLFTTCDVCPSGRRPVSLYTNGSQTLTMGSLGLTVEKKWSTRQLIIYLFCRTRVIFVHVTRSGSNNETLPDRV